MDSSLPSSGQILSVNSFEFLDFFDNANNVNDIDHFVSLIRGEDDGQFTGFDRNFITGCLDPTVLDQGDRICDFNAATGLLRGSTNDYRGMNVGTHDHGEQTLEADDNEEEDEDEEDSSETNVSMGKSKADRSKTLISERRRRGKMKEKLYALRSLVPNITKMDKASIVANAVRYVKELQAQASKLKEEIGELEASLVGQSQSQTHHQDQRYKPPSSTTIFKPNHHILSNSNHLLLSKYVIQVRPKAVVDYVL